MSNVQTHLHHIFLTLRIRICCMIIIEECFLLNVLCITKQVGIRRFTQYFPLFLNVKIRFFLLLFLKFRCSIYVLSQLLKELSVWTSAWKKKRWYIWKLEITTNEYLIFPDGIYLFKVNSRNTRIKCKICSKLTIKTQNDVSGG